jgi:hypothetical protein
MGPADDPCKINSKNPQCRSRSVRKRDSEASLSLRRTSEEGASLFPCVALLALSEMALLILVNPIQYAIRPTVRGNNKFNRDSVIKTIADVVGPEHPVDLKNYDLIILVHLIQVSCLICRLAR